MRWALPVLFVALWPRAGLAQELDVGEWLRRPGVRMLAVEFYATWCKPCMEAVPKWKALHEKYRDDGLRLVVVATQDPEGGCSSPGWNPDAIVCDDDGFLAERFGAKSLPAAFVWSWQGPLLVRQGHVEEAERAVKRWMSAAPRIDVQVTRLAARGIGKDALADLVRSKLREDDKVVVLATEAERKRLLAIKKRSMAPSQRDDQQCVFGMELSANSSLDVSVTGGKRPRLQLNLLSAEKGCLVASSVVDWRAQKPRVSVAEAVAKLFSRVRRRVELPWMKKRARAQPPPAAPPLRAPPPHRPPPPRVTEAKRPPVRAEAPPPPRSPPRRVTDDELSRALRQNVRNLRFCYEQELQRSAMFVARVEASVRVGPDGKVLDASVGPGPDHPKMWACVTKRMKRWRFPVLGEMLDVKTPIHFTPEIDGQLDVAFHTGKATIRSQSHSALDVLAKKLIAMNAGRYEIGGHTDSQGSARHNQRLSQRRAQAVLDYLVEQGVPRRLLVANGYGETKPIASNRTSRGRAQNRRIEIRTLNSG